MKYHRTEKLGYIGRCQSFSQHGHSVLLSRDVVNGFWPTVGFKLETNINLLRTGELFFDPRLTLFVRHLLSTLLPMVEHHNR